MGGRGREEAGSGTDKWLHGELSLLHMYSFRGATGKTKTPEPQGVPNGAALSLRSNS